MAFADWVMAAVFACMTLAIIVDQRRGGAVAHERPEAFTAAALVSASPPEAALADLLRGTDGWALVGPDGALLATNLQRRVALLAAACAALRLSDAAEDHARLHAAGGTLLARVSPEGFVLTAILAEGRDETATASGMSAALSLSPHLWAPKGVAPGAGRERDAVAVRRARPSAG